MIISEFILSEYSVIVMSSVAVISEEMILKLINYADNGGLLIISGPTALYSVENPGLNQ